MAVRVGKRSIERVTASQVVPAGMWPGQRMMQGTRCPPSHVVALVPRQGALLPPSSPFREPLSLVKMTSVSSSMPSSRSLCISTPVAQSMQATAPP